MKIFLSGQRSFGLAVLLMLEKRGDEIVGVAAPQEQENGKVDRLFKYAKELDVPLVSANKLRAADIPSDTDLIICAHSHAFIGRATRNAAGFGAIGYHPSLLPRHRGRDSIKWALKMNDIVTGGTVFWLNDVVDGGDIAAQEWIWIKPGDTASSIWRESLFPLGLALINKVLHDLDRGVVVRIKQNEAIATFEPALTPPRLFRPELPQLSNGQDGVIHHIESHFEETLRVFSID
jgi:methionyl-tRNA formyltransferase